MASTRNAISVYNYIATMFEEVSVELDFALPPIPKVLAIDLSLIAGMDSSTIDIFAEIKELCLSHDCRLFLCGLSPRMKQGLSLGGVKSGPGLPSKRTVRFFPDLDTALGRAEDYLLQEVREDVAERPRLSQSGFRFALEQIDELHGQEFANDLAGLESYVRPMELEAGQCLFERDGGKIGEEERGYFFIESGEIKIERNASLAMTLSRTRSSHTLPTSSVFTLKQQHARMGTIARQTALAKSGMLGQDNIRIMRIGPGWYVKRHALCRFVDINSRCPSHLVVLALTGLLGPLKTHLESRQTVLLWLLASASYITCHFTVWKNLKRNNLYLFYDSTRCFNI